MIERILRMAEITADFACDLRRYPRPATGSGPLIIAHRGAWDRDACFENTLRSFEKARSLGAQGIEFDVHFTHDNIPVVHHDPSLSRIFRHPGILESMTLRELRSVTEDLPTLADVLALKDLHFMIEIKVPMSARQIESFVSCLGDRKPVKDYHLLSIDPTLVREEADRMPANAWLLVGELNLRSRIDLSIEKGYGGVAGHYLGLGKKDIVRLHEHGQKAGVGFVPSKNMYNREWSRGIDFVFTNSTCRLF